MEMLKEDGVSLRCMPNLKTDFPLVSPKPACSFKLWLDFVALERIVSRVFRCSDTTFYTEESLNFCRYLSTLFFSSSFNQVLNPEKECSNCSFWR